MSTVSCAAWIALRTRVKKSAIGSVIDMVARFRRSFVGPLPGRLRHPGDLAVVGQLAKADAAQPELAVHRARTPAAVAPSIGLRFVLGRARLLDAQGCLCHQSLLSFSAVSPAWSVVSAACSESAAG